MMMPARAWIWRREPLVDERPDRVDVAEQDPVHRVVEHHVEPLQPGQRGDLRHAQARTRSWSAARSGRARATSRPAPPASAGSSPAWRRCRRSPRGSRPPARSPAATARSTGSPRSRRRPPAPPPAPAGCPRRCRRSPRSGRSTAAAAGRRPPRPAVPLGPAPVDLPDARRRPPARDAVGRASAALPAGTRNRTDPAAAFCASSVTVVDPSRPSRATPAAPRRARADVARTASTSRLTHGMPSGSAPVDAGQPQHRPLHRHGGVAAGQIHHRLRRPCAASARALRT